MIRFRPSRTCRQGGLEEKGKIVKAILTLCAVLFLVGGCVTQPPEVTTHYDAFSGIRTDLMADNLLETPGTPREVIWLNAYRAYKNYSSSDYYLEVSYMATAEVGWLEIAPGESLVLIVDGEPMRLKGSGSANNRKTARKDFVTENALYEVSAIQIQKIAGARQVKLQIKGDKGLVEREFQEANFERFRAFVRNYAL